jgi:hypothetical protein
MYISVNSWNQMVCPSSLHLTPKSLARNSPAIELKLRATVVKYRRREVVVLWWSDLAMASTSSCSFALRHHGHFILVVICLDCDRMVERRVSGMPTHKGWTYYKCLRMG